MEVLVTVAKVANRLIRIFECFCKMKFVIGQHLKADQNITQITSPK